MKENYKLSDFDEFLSSDNIDNSEIGFTMLSNSINIEKLSLEELMKIALTITEKYKPNNNSKARANFKRKISKTMLNFSKKQIYDCYLKIQDERKDGIK